jgi:aldehyde dehydrogenase (NAD+)/betaine-aldehyde dehydrogenase
MVLEDADLDHAVNGVLYGIFSSSGESCIAGSRLFVARSQYDAFMERLAAGAPPARGRSGRRAHPDGAADHRRHREASSVCALGVAEGGQLRTGGMRPEARLPSGYFYTPTIIEGLTTTRASARKRSSARCWWPCPSTTKTT